jgi:hypothetical protein
MLGMVKPTKVGDIKVPAAERAEIVAIARTLFTTLETPESLPPQDSVYDPLTPEEK